MTAKVASMVGLPTSSTASTATLGLDPGHLEVAVDVLHHHDGVVDEDADGEYEGEEGHPVEGIAVDIGDEDREGQGHGDRHAHDDRFPPAQGEGDEERHGERRR